MTTSQRIGADDLERQVIHNINDYGWHAVNVIEEDDGHPPWTYTISFHDTWNYPELIIIGRSRTPLLRLRRLRPLVLPPPAIPPLPDRMARSRWHLSLE